MEAEFEDRREAPLIAGSILGIRVWRASPALQELRSASTGALWSSDGGATVAVCPRQAEGVHRPPGKDCTCGLYAWHPGRSFLRVPGHPREVRPRKVLGVIEAWGRIELHARGFRAEYARPVAFINLDWERFDGRRDRDARVRYEDRLWDLADRCSAEVIDPCEGESLRQWLRHDPRVLSPSMLRDLISPGRRNI